MSKNDKKMKNTVKANVTPQTSSDIGQNYSSTQNNSSENKKGEADQYRPLTYLNKCHSRGTSPYNLIKQEHKYACGVIWCHGFQTIKIYRLIRRKSFLFSNYFTNKLEK